MSRKVILMWILMGLGAIVAGELIEGAGYAVLAPAPILLYIVTCIVWFPRSRMLVAISGSMLILLLSRSSLAPGVLTDGAPLLVSIILIIACALSWRELKFSRYLLPVVALAGMLVIPTMLYGDVLTILKAAGIAATWLLTAFAVSNLHRGDRRRLLILFVIAGCAQATIAVFESLLKVQFVRDAIAASIASGGYVERPNLILGDWTNRAQGTLGYPIPFAAFLVVVTLVILFGGVIKSIPLRASLASLTVTGILLSGSRSAFVALAAGIGAAVLMSWVRSRASGRTPRSIYWGLAAFAVLSAVGLAFFVKALITDDFSLTHRGGIVEAGWKLLSLPTPQMLVGTGYDSIQSLFDSGFFETDGPATIDNMLVSQVVTSGVVGLVLLLWTIFAALRRSGVVEAAVLVAVLATFVSYDALGWQISAFVLFTFVGLTVPRSQSTDTPSTSDSSDLRVAAPEQG